MRKLFFDSAIGKWMGDSMFKRFLLINALIFFVIQSVIVYLNLSGRKEQTRVNADLYLAASPDWTVMASRPWSIVTHMFTHVSFSHFLWNMVWLYFAGQMFEAFFGKRKFAAVYIVGGLFGYLVLTAVTAVLPLPSGLALGASAAIMAIFVASAVHSPDRQIMFFGVFPVKLKILAVIYVLVDYMALRGEVNLGGHIAHLAGAAFGFLYAWQLGKGVNILKWYEKAVVAFSRPRNRMKTVHRSAREMTDEEYNMRKVRNDKQVDAILDKIARGGYDSLTLDEKDFLFRHSKRN